MRVWNYLVILCGLFWLCAAYAESLFASDLNEEIAYLPMTFKVGTRTQITRSMILTLYKPSGIGPFPMAILNHGRDASAQERAKPRRVRFEEAARYFVRKGFAVLVPTRIGYGDTGQDFDPEESGSCLLKSYQPSLDAAAKEIVETVAYARTLPWVDAKRIVLMGQSVGGISTTAAAANNPAGVVAAINFAGGAGGDALDHPGIPCDSDQLRDNYAGMGKTAKVPMLWVYTQNDKLFGPEVSRGWARAYQESGAPLEYRLLPSFGHNGHFLFASGGNVWMPLVDSYLRKFGFERPGTIARPKVTNFASVEQVEKVPFISAEAREQGYQYFLASPSPRAFAISSGGGWSAAQGGDALGRALSDCQRSSSTPCKLYAVDDDVVWEKGQPLAQEQAPHHHGNPL